MKAFTSLFVVSLTAASSLSAQFASSPFTENFDGTGAVFNPAFWGPQVTLRGNGGTLSQGSGVLNWQAGAPTGDSNSQALPSVCFVPFNVAFTVNATVTIPDSTVFQNISAGGDVALGIGVFSGRELLTQPGFNPANPTIGTIQNNIGIEGLVFNPDGGGVATNSIRVQSDVSAAGADPLDELGEVIDEPGDIVFGGNSATIGIQISWDPIEAVMTTAITSGGNEGTILQFLNLPEAWGDGTLGDFGSNADTDVFGLNIAGFASDEVFDGEIVMDIYMAETPGGNFFVHVPEPTTVTAFFGLLVFAGTVARRRLRQA